MIDQKLEVASFLTEKQTKLAIAVKLKDLVKRKAPLGKLKKS
jgi:hypothetical protein